MRHNNFRKKIALSLALLTLFQAIQAPVAYALTSGPTQPEVQSFEPAGTTEMVDLFSGDFTYNIPLFELPGPNGGYPFNLSYHAGIGMDQEASWVGLGWNLNPGAVNRQMRGVPDEFNGDLVHTKMSMNPSVTAGIGAGASLEVFGGDAIKAKVGFSIYNNNYKGIGYSIDGSLGFGRAAGAGQTAGLGIGVSLDSQEGIDISPSLTLGSGASDFYLGAGYNSKVGLKHISSGLNFRQHDEAGEFNKNVGGASYSLSLHNPGFTPQVAMPFKNTNISADFKAGGSWWGVFAFPYVSGFYNKQQLRNDKVRVASPAYGYLNYQNATEADALQDFNREKDGVVRKESPNLPIPSLTYDIYSLTGQGIAAMYRPMRNDNGIIHDPVAESISVGGSVGVDASPALSHVGVNLGVNHARSLSGKWSEDNEIASHFQFQQKNINDLYEPWYYKIHGERTANDIEAVEAIGGEAAVRVQLGGTNKDPVAKSTLENKFGSHQAPNNSNTFRNRKPRGEVITPIKNQELLQDTEEVLSQFKIQHYDAAGSLKKFSRNTLPKHHFAGITALTADGLRYNYALPAYNHYQEEALFSAKKLNNASSLVATGDGGNGDPFYEHPGTDKFLQKTEIPAYAHSYLLTSIVGPDYVDVTGDGVSEDDLGYWVKFTYKQVATKSDPYKWRAPFSQALLSEGLKTDDRDDKGSYTYGEKEIWYLARAETKSHIATFITEQREDSRGAAHKLQDTNQLGKRLHALKEIRLFTRSAGSQVPIKVVKLEHDYALCKGVDNSTSNDGKLTLKKLWFEYGTSQRGRLNPYRFEYHQNNPNYDINASDRWGIYKPYPTGDPLHNQEFPYTEQDPAKKQEIDNNVAAWSLKEINLPSGGKIMIDYESDDYAYVQHLPAMQMMEIVDNSNATANTFNLNDDDMKVRFKLKRPIEGTLSAQEQKDEVIKYLDKNRSQLYFKLKINLRSPSEEFQEFITGYADIDMTGNMGLDKEGGTAYQYGYFYVKKENGHHPFSMRAWQHLRVNQPELANIGAKMEPTDDSNKMVEQIKALASIIPQVRQMFEGFYNYCADKNWGRQVVVGKSWIRLSTPDKVKYGGGLRVKQITMSDQWQHDEEGIYGQVYDYSMLENGTNISSGVAVNEPYNGGDENALRYAKKYVQSVPLRTDNNLFFEFPVNESYYPGPGVGYRKVTVKSLAAASLAGEEVKNIMLSDQKSLFPKGEGITYGTTGVTVHEFYTAKDFPVITDETEKDNKSYKLFVPVPLIGTISVTNLAASQGYSIVTNDMHGKPKRVSNYRQDQEGNTEPEPISWVQYNYLQEERIQDGRKVLALKNTLKETDEYTVGLLEQGDLSNPVVRKYKMGQETEFFIDARQHTDETWVGGVSVNLDIMYIPVLFAVIPIPVLVPWPNVSKNSQQLRTVVSNKVIFETGVLESVEAYDGGSRLKTQNLQWDKLTGRPLLTTVNNNFEEPVYTYHIPAYTQYQGMGAAYQNIGYTFEITDVDNLPYHDKYYQFKAGASDNLLFPGDEMILYRNMGNMTNPVGKVVFSGKESGDMLLYSDQQLADNQYKAMIVRSGYRNQLNINAGSVTALENPSLQGEPVTHQKVIRIPVEK